MCGIVLPWGIYRYKCLPQGIKIATDVFQRILGKLFSDMDNVKMYIDDYIIVGHGTYEEHLKDVEEVLKRLTEAGLQVNAEKCKWAAKELYFLGFVLTHKGFEPDPAKIEALLNMSPPQNLK